MGFRRVETVLMKAVLQAHQQAFSAAAAKRKAAAADHVEETRQPLHKQPRLLEAQKATIATSPRLR